MANKLVPATRALSVTASDSTTYQVCRGVWIGTAGDLAVEMSGDPVGESITFPNVQDGTLLPLSVRKVLATGTTASNIRIIY